MSDLQNPQLMSGQPQSAQHASMGAAEVFGQILEAFKTGNLQVLFELIAEDAVMEFPFAPPGRPRRVEGKDNIIKYNMQVMSITKVTGLKEVEIHRMIDPDCVVIEMTGYGTVLATGDAYERRYIDVCRTKNGRIQLIRDYWNPQESPAVKG